MKISFAASGLSNLEKSSAGKASTFFSFCAPGAFFLFLERASTGKISASSGLPDIYSLILLLISNSILCVTKFTLSLFFCLLCLQSVSTLFTLSVF